MKKEHFLIKKATFYEKRAPKIYPHPYPLSHSIPFLSILHKKKALYIFRKWGQGSIVERNIGLEYSLTSLKDFLSINNTEP